MTSPLHEYQKQAVRFALDAFRTPVKGCGLFLEPGLGKTLTSIAIMDILHEENPDGRFLVVAPALVARNSWPDELARWHDLHDLDWAAAVGTPRQRLKAIERNATVTIIGRDSLDWLDRTLKHWPYSGIIVDELSGFKTPGSTRSRILRRHARHADWVLGLTGTPATKSLLDLWGEISIIDRSGILDTSITRYRTKWFTPDRYVNAGGMPRPVSWKPKPGAQERILDLIRPFCLSMTAHDMLPGLPAMITVDHWLDMPHDTRTEYEHLRHDMVAELPDGITVTAANAGVLTGKLSQLTCGCLYPDPDDEDRRIGRFDDVKLDELDRIIHDTATPILVFYQYTDELDRMRDRIPGLREIHEPNIIDQWNKGEIHVLAAHPQAAKYGLNMQSGGHDIVWTSLPWSFDDYRQACDRLHRQGQRHPVRVHRLLESGTVDARKRKVLDGRIALHEAVMSTLKDD
ncbi:SNF2-related protein [Bifidobacterium sp. SO1]|uniref:SNF2-related protein n=1 Tax=Bifidobacterium sp. SO1 TaxID=2809029 RepID=UPI001BDD3580|nr:SNF2-related protein [Bifidobacterium sp. SO1]MBT1162735.1 DEAD/DEAH box helicase family protein [Bifidobacterium sp. SO1]